MQSVQATRSFLASCAAMCAALWCVAAGPACAEGSAFEGVWIGATTGERVVDLVLVVETKDGRTLRAREEFNRGSDGQPLSEADVVRKFTDNAARVLSPSRVQQVLELTMALDRAADVVALTDALAR